MNYQVAHPGQSLMNLGNFFLSAVALCAASATATTTTTTPSSLRQELANFFPYWYDLETMPPNIDNASIASECNMRIMEAASIVFLASPYSHDCPHEDKLFITGTSRGQYAVESGGFMTGDVIARYATEHTVDALDTVGVQVMWVLKAAGFEPRQNQRLVQFVRDLVVAPVEMVRGMTTARLMAGAVDGWFAGGVEDKSRVLADALRRREALWGAPVSKEQAKEPEVAYTESATEEEEKIVESVCAPARIILNPNSKPFVPQAQQETNQPEPTKPEPKKPQPQKQPQQPEKRTLAIRVSTKKTVYLYNMLSSFEGFYTAWRADGRVVAVFWREWQAEAAQRALSKKYFESQLV